MSDCGCYILDGFMIECHEHGVVSGILALARDCLSSGDTETAEILERSVSGPKVVAWLKANPRPGEV